MLLLLPSRSSAFFSGVIHNSRVYGSLRRQPCRRLTAHFSSKSQQNEPPVEISPSNHGTRPLRSLTKESLNIDARLLQALASQNLTKPTPIQTHAIPLLQEGFDVMASAQTGSGKTLMFSLSLCDKLLKLQTKTRGPPQALILCPTRELAMQTAAVLRNITQQTSLEIALATGGAPVSQQRKQVNYCNVLVGTPGRILQFVDERTLSLGQVQEVVVDEADQMMDLGFEPQLDRIARALQRNQKKGDTQPSRHTVLCSATFPPQVQRVACEFLQPSYYFVAAGRVGASHEQITQTLHWLDGNPAQRQRAVLEEIRLYQQAHKQKGKDAKSALTLVFCNTKEQAERLGAAIPGSVRVVHGDKPQSERTQSLQAFRDGKIQTLVATDVAARGLHVAGIGLVLQAETPRNVDTYVHRAGRTGRAGATGHNTAFLDGKSVGIAPGLVQLLHETKQTVPAWLLGMAHVAQARITEEEGAIAAGGGNMLDVQPNLSESSSSDSNGSEEFSDQDFRSQAAAGSWGSERDTSYRAFDEEAYSSLDGRDASTNDTESATFVEKATEPAYKDEATKNLSLTENDTQINENGISFSKPTFKREQPSQELLQAVQQISGLSKIGQHPNPKVLRTLAKRGVANQKLRFEYLGMFPFEKVVKLLVSRDPSRYGADRSNGMPRVLMVAEKPSIAQAIAEALSGPGGPRKRRGISHALPVYEFTSNAFVPCQTEGDGDTPTACLVTVTSVVGHVFSLGFVQEKTDGFPDPSEYFHMPVVKQEEGSTGKLRVVDHLRALAADCDHLVLWLDCDAEGENIAHEVIGVTRRARFSSITRARFSSITRDALRDAFQNLVEPDAALSRSVDARQELDLRVGVALTRLLTWKCVGLARRNFSPTTKMVSYGPCQTPALSFCVDRAREIEAFEPQDYWKVEITAKMSGGDKGPLPLRWKVSSESAVKTKVSQRGPRKEGTITERVEESATFDQMAAQQVAKLAAAPNSRATIVRVRNISERLVPPVGLNTVSLLTAGSKAMGMSPKQVMGVAEKLYAAGYISYPRTESTFYDPTGFDVRPILREHASHPEWGRTASFLLNKKYRNSGRPPLRGHDAGDHPPITCTKVGTRDEVGGGAAWRVYEFVCRTFLGSLGDELLYTRQVAELELDSNSEHFSTDPPRFQLEQVQVDSVGFAGACRWVLRDIGAAEKDSNIVFEEGMQLEIANARCERRATKPPRFLQEHELIEQMDTNRIGTDASMATHVNNIVDRGYVTLCDETGVPLRPYMPPRKGQPRRPRQIGRYLVPSPLGISLLDLFSDTMVGTSGRDSNGESLELLSRPAIRAQMEAEVKQIAIGEQDKNECVEKNLKWFEKQYSSLANSLSRQRINDFARTLRPVKESLRYWQRLGCFEPQKPGQQNGHTQGKKTNRRKPTRGGKSSKRKFERSGGANQKRVKDRRR